MNYAGELEFAKTKDLFTLELADYYKTNADRHLNTLQAAHRHIKNGYSFCLAANFSKALTEFQTAKKLFDEAGNVWESQIAAHFIAYSNYNANNFDADPQFWTQNIEFCRQRNFKWLELSNLYWLAGIQEAAGKYRESRENFEKALALAGECRDQYFLQKIYLALATQSAFFGENKNTLNFLEKVLFHTRDKTGARQKWRNYRQIINTLGSLEFYDLAFVIAQENIILAKRLNDPIFQAESLIIAGSVGYKKKDYDGARRFFEEAKEKISLLDEPATRNFHYAQAALEIGQMERESGNHRQSLDFYDQAISFDDQASFNPFSYAAQKGKLYSLIALGNTVELDRQIPITLKTAEKYRREILEEERRNSFFDSEQSIYDLATEHEFNQGRYETAYEHSETSNSRSLLDWLQKGADVDYQKSSQVKILLKGTSEPFNLAQIRSQLPENVQILQYSVLENKTLIWLITRDKFEVVSTEIKSEELREKVKTYVKFLTDKSALEETASRELYDLLIKPVENSLDREKKICLIPNKSLHHLPFAALRSPREQTFLSEHEIFYSSSANVFLLATQTAQNRHKASAESILSIGNPSFNRQLYRELQDLPSAEGEARQIAAFYGEAKVLVSAQPTKQLFKSLAPKYDVIHFAGHYLVNSGAPLSSGLLLSADKSDERSELTNAELVSQSLPKTKLVILSACETGVENYLNGEGLIGLSRTFLASGVPVVVASQWQVDSDATAALMKKFHRFRSLEKMSSSAALRRAQLEMLNDEKYRTPYFWAAFAVFGGYADF